MINATVIQIASKILTMKICLKILIILPFLLETYERVSPSKYAYLKSSVTIRGLEVETLKNIVKKVFEILVHINFMIVNIMIIIIVCGILSYIIRKIIEGVGYYGGNDNNRRKGLLSSMICMYAYVGIIIYDVALLSKLLLNDEMLLKIINVTSVFWISKAVFIWLAVGIVIVLIVPVWGRS